MLIISKPQLRLIKYRRALLIWVLIYSWHQQVLIQYLTQSVWSMYRLLDTLPLYLYYELLILPDLENQDTLIIKTHTTLNRFIYTLQAEYLGHYKLHKKCCWQHSKFGGMNGEKPMLTSSTYTALNRCYSNYTHFIDTMIND